MSYLLIDDVLVDHPKIHGLSDLAFRLHITALCYCARHLTDGIFNGKLVPAWMPDVPRTSRARAVRQLVDTGVWTRKCAKDVPPAFRSRSTRVPRNDHISTIYEIHDYLDWNPSREEALERRKARSEAGKRGAAARWRGTSDDVTSNGKGHSKSRSDRNAPVPSPSLPPNPRTAGEQEKGDLEPLTPREAGTNPRARNQQTKAQRAHASFVDRTKGLYQQWLAEPDADPDLVAHQIRQAYPDIADEVLA